jgi:hypothetical protein
MGAGESFGEIALLRRIPRTATVTALSRLEARTLACEEFLAAVTGNPESRTRGAAVSHLADRIAVSLLTPDRRGWYQPFLTARHVMPMFRLVSQTSMGSFLSALVVGLPDHFILPLGILAGMDWPTGAKLANLSVSVWAVWSLRPSPSAPSVVSGAA